MKILKLFSIILFSLSIFSCKKESYIKGRGTVSDIDSNVYQTVTIGTQVWMAENLKTTRYNDGTTIATDLSDVQWYATDSGAYAIYDNNAANNNTYGKLYNWNAVNTGKLAPIGWHVPTDVEWSTLISYIGDYAGFKMKSNSSLWTAPNSSDNSSGFSGLPGGIRESSGIYIGIGNSGDWWSSTKIQYGTAGIFELNYSRDNIVIADLLKTMGLSVRCVKD